MEDAHVLSIFLLLIPFPNNLSTPFYHRTRTPYSSIRLSHMHHVSLIDFQLSRHSFILIGLCLLCMRTTTNVNFFVQTGGFKLLTDLFSTVNCFKLVAVLVNYDP